MHVLWNIFGQNLYVVQFFREPAVFDQLFLTNICFVFVLTILEKLLNYNKCQNLKDWRRLAQFMFKYFFVGQLQKK